MGAVSLRSTTLLFFSFSFLFRTFLLVAWPLFFLAATTLLFFLFFLFFFFCWWPLCFLAAGISMSAMHVNRPTLSVASSIISRGSMQRGTSPAKGHRSLQAAQMEPSSTPTGVRRARHPNLQLSPTTTPFPTRDGTRQGCNPYQTWDWPIAAMAALGQSTNAFIYPSSPLPTLDRSW